MINVYGRTIDSNDVGGIPWLDTTTEGIISPQLGYIPFKISILPWLSQLLVFESDKVIVVFEPSDNKDEWDSLFNDVRTLLACQLHNLKYLVIKLSISLISKFEPQNDLIQYQLKQLITLVPHLIVELPLLNNIQLWRFYFRYIRLDNLNISFELIDANIITSILQPLSIEKLQYIKLNVNHDDSFNHLIYKLVNLYNYKQLPIILPQPLQPSSIISSLTLPVHNPTFNTLIDPLQPLRDDLDISIYEQFEQDFIKYNQYEKAIELSILDLIATNKFNSTAIKIIIIGPGKGGILHKLINVVNKFSHQTFKIYAFEKNIKCIPYLHKYNQQNWNNQLEIIQDDIRNQNITNVNLIISELLGSFGDNELCPEILQQFNKPQTYPMIMIPSSYTSYLQPVSTDLTIPEFERPYIVKLTKYISLSPFKPVFDWDYPDPSLSSLDKVTTALNFKVENGLLDVVTITGFYGYFTADLYGHLTIQIINDEDRDTYCKSWYPFYFPIDPEDIDNGTSVEFNICRINNGVDKVWYEWEFNDKVYNKNGNHYYIEF